MSRLRLKILILDDKRVIGDLFGFILGFNGHMICVFDDAQKALDALAKEKFDIAFLDIIMPGRDGLSVLKEMRAIAPQLPVIMMSGYFVEEKRHQAEELGALTCLEKPFEMDEVRQVVKSALGKDI